MTAQATAFFDRVSGAEDEFENLLRRAWTYKQASRLNVRCPWRSLCRKALRERDPERLPEKIAWAEAAVERRWKRLQGRRRNSDRIEKRALLAAVLSLNDLKRRYFPDWNFGKRRGPYWSRMNPSGGSAI